jgi:glycosyltransferase involved in cell wall biosynthesis
VKTGQTAPSVVQVNYALDNDLTDPDALVERYATLAGWAQAIAQAGARKSAVVQRFHRRATLVRDGIEYRFARSGIGAAVASLEPDIAHVNGLVFPIRTWTLRRALARPTAIVVQNHSDTGPLGRAPLLRVAGRATRTAADAFLFAAPEHVERWRAAGFIAPGQPTYCVMESSTRLQPLPYLEARERIKLAGSPAMLWVGRLNANKDPLAVLAAFDACADALPAATLTMIFTTNELLEEVRGRLSVSGALAARVRLVGAIPHAEIAAYFSGTDLFIVGSHHEGSGYAVIEALACGAMPVVTDIPTFRLLTGNGEAGILWAAGDTQSCASAILRAASRPIARDRIVAYFNRDISWTAIGRRALEIYSDVIRRRLSAGRIPPGPA